MPLALTQRKLHAPSRPSFSAGRKLGDVEKAWWWTLLHADPQCPSRLLLDKVTQGHAPMDISVRHRHRLRGGWQLHRPKGRPRQAPCRRPAASGGEVVQMRPRVLSVGVPLWAQWLDHQGACEPVLAQLTQAIEAHQHAHPGDDFALGHHREQTLLRRFQALCCAPLVGSDRRTACDPHAPPLATLLGRHAHSATLQQCLGPLERVGAGEALLPARVPAQAGQSTSIDGPMLASGSRVAMHTGQSTMRGRILAGSQAVIAPHADGHAVLVASHPPDIHVSRRIVADGQQVVEATGRPLCVIDRAVHALAMAAACAEPDWGLLCRLDDHAPHGLERVEATSEGLLDEGSHVESGPWTAPRDDALRPGVIVEPAAGKTLGSWGTPKVQEALAPTAWPRVSRARTERQENRGQRLIDHGALARNYGRTKIVGPDRHPQRQRAPLDASLETAPPRVDTPGEAGEVPQVTVAESTSPRHGKRLEQRQQALVRVEEAREGAQHHQAQRAPHASAFGAPRERADRDVRHQTIMTCRTVWLEQALMACMAIRLGHLHSKGR